MTATQVDPHRATRVDLSTTDTVLAALDTGAGPDDAVLLVPGYTGSKEDFVPLLNPLADAGWRGLAIDLPGQYESEGPDDEDAYRPERLAEPVTEVIHRLRAEHRGVVLLGHSFGGLVARAAVLAGAPVDGLTLLCSGPSRLTDEARHGRLDIAEMVLRSEGIEALQGMREMLEPPAEPAELAALLRNRFLRSSPAGLLGMATVLRTEPDRTALLAARLVRTGAGRLVACGVDDDAWAVDVQRDMAARLDAPFELVPNSGHTPNTENPSMLLEILLRHWRTWI